MPFGIIGWMGPGMRQLVGFADRSTRKGTFGANLGHAIVTNGDFTTYVCDSAAMRPSSQITLGRLVSIIIIIIIKGIYKEQDSLRGHKCASIMQPGTS